jgi:hypothetical protein
MCVTAPVPASFKLHPRAKKRVVDPELQAFIDDGSAQWLPRQRDHTEQFVSRLQCVATACHQQIAETMKSFPRHRLCLVTFAGEVTLHGDCTATPTVLSGTILSDSAKLQTAGAAFGGCKIAASESGEAMIDRVYSLEEGGPTALGPAIAACVGIASRAPAGSKLLVATDGLSNCGVGDLETGGDAGREFYKTIAMQARAVGVTINVISIGDQETSLEHLGTLADLTRGTVDIVEPATLGATVLSALNKPVIATNCTVRLLVRGCKPAEADIGNATADTQISFQWEVPPSATATSAVPVQIQLRYNLPDES